MSETNDLLDREWFYPFELPDGSVTPTYGGGKLDEVHSTRLKMMDAALWPIYPDGLQGASAVDLACHQGYFSTELVKRGAGSVVSIDARDSHVEDTRRIATAMQMADRIEARQSDVHAIDTGAMGTFDVVLMLGLIYHLENPIGAMRTARELTGRVCLIETQVVPHLSGPVDWGNYHFVKDMKGCFGIIDETYETHGPEASTLGICLAPSTPGLMWIMEKLGFDRVALIPPPDNAYEQHRYGKRVMVAGYID